MWDWRTKPGLERLDFCLCFDGARGRNNNSEFFFNVFLFLRIWHRLGCDSLASRLRVSPDLVLNHSLNRFAQVFFLLRDMPLCVDALTCSLLFTVVHCCSLKSVTKAAPLPGDSCTVDGLDCPWSTGACAEPSLCAHDSAYLPHQFI